MANNSLINKYKFINKNKREYERSTHDYGPLANYAGGMAGAGLATYNIKKAVKPLTSASFGLFAKSAPEIAKSLFKMSPESRKTAKELADSFGASFLFHEANETDHSLNNAGIVPISNSQSSFVL